MSKTKILKKKTPRIEITPHDVVGKGIAPLSYTESFAGIDRKEIEKQFKTTITTVNVSYEELILSELTAIRKLLEKGIGVFEIEK